MKPINLSLLFNIEELFPEGKKEIFIEPDTESMTIVFNMDGFTIGEKYRNIFEKCALNIKEMGVNHNYSVHKFDVEVIVSDDNKEATIRIPLYSIESVIRNLGSYYSRKDNV